jgi:catechol 2,3-dioxygenase
MHRRGPPIPWALAVTDDVRMSEMPVLTGAEAGGAGFATLPDALRLGAVHLTVSDLDRSVAWYQRALGLRVHRHDVHEAALGDGEADVLVLHEHPGAAPAAGRHAGLYHYALLLPSREELARAALRLARTRTPIQGASDHGTHEAIYLPDPDGNGIELAADRPREAWPTPQQEFSGGGPRPLDFDSLLATVGGPDAETDQVAPGLRTGHLHLHVGDIDEGLAFYRDVIGFAVWALLPRSAAFVSAGGYHHHLGFNVWRGQGVGRAPDGTVGLDHWTVVLPTAADVDEVRGRVAAAGYDARDVDGGFAVQDPWRTELHVVAAP